MGRSKILALFLIVLLLISGCTDLRSSKGEEASTEGKKNLIQEEEKKENLEEEIEIDYKKIKPNELGDILVVMYHGLVKNDPPSIWQRTIEGFKKDLEYMYENDYRPITMKDYIENNIDIEAGYTPIVITFDDSLSSSYSMQEVDGELIPTKDTAVDIMNKFAQENPDFGKAAIFFMNANPFMRDSLTDIKGQGDLKERLEYLLDQGYELGNHTFTHPKLNQLKETEVQKEIGEINNMVKEVLPEATLDYFSYPFGLRPDDKSNKLIISGQYDGVTYNHSAAVREAPRSPYFVPPVHKDFDIYNISRTVGTEGNDMDLWWYFKDYEKNPDRRYISDGNPDRISIPKELEDQLDKKKIEKDKEVYLYDLTE
jgi:peptidoglycan/xylan/chitin deacetylase (PgdA/CDA1 family)